jgi:hypothetical protein
VKNSFLSQIFGAEPYDVRCWDFSVGPEHYWHPYPDGFEKLSTAREVARRTSRRECGPPPRRKRGWSW